MSGASYLTTLVLKLECQSIPWKAYRWVPFPEFLSQFLGGPPSDAGDDGLGPIVGEQLI